MFIIRFINQNTEIDYAGKKNKIARRIKRLYRETPHNSLFINRAAIIYMLQQVVDHWIFNFQEQFKGIYRAFLKKYL